MELRGFQFGPPSDRGFNIFQSPQSRFRELEFCSPVSGSSTIDKGKVEAFILACEQFEEEPEEELEEKIREDVVVVVETAEQKVLKEEKEEDNEEQPEEDISNLPIFIVQEKPKYQKKEVIFPKKVLYEIL